MAIRVLIADDHAIIRDGLVALLEKNKEIEVVGQAENGRRAVHLARKIQPDLVVMDVSMPDLNGIEATRQVLAENPDMKVIALSMHSDKRFVMGMLQAGAAGYLLKDCAAEELTTAITAVAAGKKYLSPDITGFVIDDCLVHPEDSHTCAATLLSNREREVLQLIAEGNSTRETADILFVSIKTIETHRRQIMKKLDIHSVADLTKYAIREGLTTL